MLCIFAVLVLAFQGVQVVQGQYGPEENELLSWPGYNGELRSPQYSGYIQIPDTEKQLYYILVVSENSPEDDPLVLWINGGPGCSSLGGGFIEENGPFNYTPTTIGEGGLLFSDVTLQDNPYSWSKVANMLYIDSPAGVGLSYSTDPTDYVTDDYQTTQDLYEALLAWFAEYTYFANHTFIITGESYAGVYIPLTASLILDGLDAGTEPTINLAAYAIGNPTSISPDTYNLDGVYKGFNLISEKMSQALDSTNCPETSDYDNNVYDDEGNDFDAEACSALQDNVMTDTSAVFNYDINKNCFYGTETFGGFIFNETKQRLADQGIQWEDELTEYQPIDDYCDYDDRVAGWLLNDQTVRDAIHADGFANETQTLAGFFRMCTSRLNYTTIVNNTVPYHADNIARGLEVLIYSGDHDTVVPTEGTERWTSQLGEELGVIQPWTPWWIAKPEAFGYQIGGYLTQYDGLSFLTIRSAGHQVPTTSPAEAYSFFSAWIQGGLNETTSVPDNLVMTGLFPSPGVQSYRKK